MARETAVNDEIRTLALATAPRPNLVVLTGAGISAESGIRTYRGPDGMYDDGEARRLVTVEALRTDRGSVVRHFQGWRETVLQAEPNAAHRALARLGEALGKQMTLATQNIDTLHDRAGSQGVVAMHGDLATLRCEGRGHVQPWSGTLREEDRCGETSWRGKVCGEPLRPHVVLFGEPVLHAADIDRAVSRCTALWAIGTSGVVMPAAGLVLQARMRGAVTALFNLTPPGAEAQGSGAATLAAAYDWVILGKATDTVPRAVDALLGELG